MKNQLIALSLLFAALALSPSAPAQGTEHCLTNIAELKTRDAGFVPCVAVLGYYAPGDGGGGNFYWDASANVDLARFPSGEDGGTVIKPNSLLPSVPGRWRRVQGAPVNVRWFGAKGDGTNDDREEIQGAIQFSESSQSPTVWFPPGRYLLARALRAEVDNLTLLGSAGAVLVADPPDGEPFAEAILVNKDATPLGEVLRVTIRDLTIEVKNGATGEVSMGVIQLNNCKECAVRNVHVKYVGPTPKPKSIDGIVTSQGTSGFIQNCIVDGIPLAGIYAAQGAHDLIIESCEVKNTFGPELQAGISVSGSDRILIKNCLSHNNGWAGLSIGVNKPIGTNAPVPAKNIQVVGGLYYSNGIGTVVSGIGIAIGSASDGVRPEHIQLIGVTALYNNKNGICVEAGWDVLMASPTVADSGAHGILIVGPGQSRTTRIQISNPNVSDNGRLVNIDVAGIGLDGTDNVTITGGKFSTTVTGRRQKYGIGLSSSVSSNCTNIRILDPDGSVGLAQPVAAQELSSAGALDPSAAAQSGFYRIQSGGNPEGVLAAPAGSEYVDLLTGFSYRKAVGTGTNGWTVSANLSASAPWDPPPISNGATAKRTFRASGVGIGDPVAVGFSQPVPGGALLVGSVTAPNRVTVTLLNLTGARLNLARGTLRADVRPH